MSEEESKKLSIINKILRLESSTKDALRSSRDEIESLQVVANQKKDEVAELEKELSALLECKVKKKRALPSLRPKRLRRLTTSSGPEGDATMFRRNTISEMGKKPDSASIAGVLCDEGDDDDGASCTFTVGTFDNASLWNSSQCGDASTFNGGGSAVSNDTTCIGSFRVTVEILNEKQNLLSRKQAELEQYKQKHRRNATILQQMHQQLSVIQREQKMYCDGYNSSIESLAKTKTDLVARIRWRENRILEEGQKLSDLKLKFAAAKRAEIDSSQCSNQLQSSASDDEDYTKFMKLTTECADLLTEFSSSAFDMIKSTITLPEHSSISYSIGYPSDTSTIDKKMDQKQHEIKNQREEKQASDEQQQLLDELNKSVQHCDAKIQMVQNEITTVNAAYMEETNANKLIIDDLEKHVASLNERLVKGGNEIKRLIQEVESLSAKEQELLQIINAPDIIED